MGDSEAVLYVASAAAFVVAAALFALRSEGATRRWLVAWLAIDAVHAVAHGAAAITQDAGWGQALTTALHVPSFFGFVVAGLFVTGFTGIHARAWRHPAVFAALLVVPVAMLVTELRFPAPFWRFSPDGAHLVGGELAAWAGAYGFMHMLFDVYFVAVVAYALVRATRPEAVAARAFVLAFLLVRQVPVVWGYVSEPARWAFASLAGLDSVVLLPNTVLVHIAVAVVASLVIFIAADRSPVPQVRIAGRTVAALAAIVNVAVAFGAGSSIPLTNFRSVFGAALLSYVAVRHGLDGERTGDWSLLSVPLNAVTFAVLLVTFYLTLALFFVEWVAVVVAMACALVAFSLVFVLSNHGQAAPAGTASGPTPGTLVAGRFVAERALRGGAGAAFLAHDARSGEHVVLKFTATPDGARRVKREAEAVRRVAHPNVVRLRDVVDTPFGPCLVLDYEPGGALADRIESGPLTTQDFDRTAAGLLQALATVHAAGLLHRDIKPANVLFAADGTARLTDFDVASVPDLEATLADAARSDAPVGTVRYMAPEVAAGGAPSRSSDLYSAAATLYEAWTGHPVVERRPFETVVELIGRVARGVPVPQDAVGGALGAWFTRALAADPARRFPDAAAMEAALAAALQKQPARGRGAASGGDPDGVGA